MKTFNDWLEELPEEIRTAIQERKDERLIHMGWQAAMEVILEEKLQAESKVFVARHLPEADEIKKGFLTGYTNDPNSHLHRS